MLENLETKNTTSETKTDLTAKPCENIGKEKRKCWSKEEIEKLKLLYEIEGKSLSDLVLKFVNRTENSIHLKIKRLKLKHTTEQKFEIWSKVRTGNKNPMYGKVPATKGFTKHNLECLRKGGEKLSNTIKEKIKRGEWISKKGKDNPMFGKSSWSKGLTKNTCEKLRIAGEKNSITNRKRFEKMTQEEKTKYSQKIKSHITDDIRYKMRVSAINRIKQRGVGYCRNYNPTACKYFDELNKQNGWNLQHAENGGEVECYGYFLDAYDKNRNILIEYDEPYHKKPSVKAKDDKRQKNIMSILKPNIFLRYDETTKTLNKVV